MARKDISSIRTMKSKLTPKILSSIMKKYHIAPKFNPLLHEDSSAIVDALKGFFLVLPLRTVDDLCFTRRTIPWIVSFEIVMEDIAYDHRL